MNIHTPTCLILDAAIDMEPAHHLFPSDDDPNKYVSYVTLDDYYCERALRLRLQKALGTAADTILQEIGRVIRHANTSQPS